MGLNLVKKIFENLGENNKATYAVMAIAVAKGTFRPMFTMMDKKQDPESKKYAAFREGVTEGIAIPTYYCSGVLASKLAPKFLKESLVKVGSEEEKNVLNLTKDLRQKFDDVLHIKADLKKQHKTLDEINDGVQNALKDLKFGAQKIELFEDYSTKLKIVQETTPFVGVCLAALLVIPGLCNVVLPPIMKHFKGKSNTNAAIAPVNNEPKPAVSINRAKLNDTNLLNVYLAPKTSGMKVGM